ncbi:MAG: amidohydrolase family protein [Gemmatimonadales bacterium]
MRLAAAAWLAAGLAVAGCDDGTARTRRLVVDEVTVVSPGLDRGAPVPVAIEGDRIVAIGADARPRPGDSVIDGRGRFLTPGLIDGHVHLASPAGLPSQPPAELEQVVADYFRQLPRSYLYHGFTTLVDLGLVDRAVFDRFGEAPAHPDLYHCGPSLPLEQGYPTVFLPPALAPRVFPNFLADPRLAPAPSDTVDHSPEAAVARAVAAGGICIKTYYEDGFGDRSDWPTPPLELIRRVRSESEARHVVLAMHANAYRAWQFAAAVPADLIVHGMWNWDGQEPNGTDSLPESIRIVLDSVLARGIGFMPTLRVIEGIADLFDSTFLADPRLGRVVPAGAIARYRSRASDSYRAEIAGGAPDRAVMAGLRAGAEGAALVTRYLIARGGRLVFGSDTPSGPTYANPPGLNGFLELERLAAGGVPLDRLLAAATIDAARAFALGSLYGTIEVGKVANLLLLAKDPLAAVDAYDAIDAVISRGRAIGRASLAADR